MGIRKESGPERKFDSGAKRQAASGKGIPSLFPPDAYLDICKHFEDGAVHYGGRNWEKGLPLSSYIDSLERHIAQEKMGLTDESHDRAIAWNAICYLATKLRIKAGILPKKLNDLCGVYGKSNLPEKLINKIDHIIGEDIENVPHPICPLNLYFEGDENICNPANCDYEPESRSCNTGCKQHRYIADDCVIGKRSDGFYCICSLINGYFWRDLKFHVCTGSGAIKNVDGYFSTKEEAEECLQEYRGKQADKYDGYCEECYIKILTAKHGDLIPICEECTKAGPRFIGKKGGD